MNEFYKQNPAFLKSGTIYSIPEPPKKEWRSGKGMSNGSGGGDGPLMPPSPTNGNLENDDSVTATTSGGGDGGADLPTGDEGDLLVFTGGIWTTLSPPSEGEVALYWNGSVWDFAELIEFDICENGEAVQYRIPAILVEE
jgi:hypothetical protein